VTLEECLRNIREMCERDKIKIRIDEDSMNTRSDYNPLSVDAYTTELEDALNSYDAALLALVVTSGSQETVGLYKRLCEEHKHARSRAIKGARQRMGWKDE
jgi:hypothetical protein